MSQQHLSESTKIVKQRIACREAGADPTRSGQGGYQAPILQLQRTLGNQRVARLIQAKRLTPEGRIIDLQRKLIVGAEDDHLEQEADRVSRQVVSMPDSVARAAVQPAPPAKGEAGYTRSLQSKPLPLAASITPFVQQTTRKADNREEEEKDKTDQAVQAKRVNDPVFLPFQPQHASEKKEEEPVQARRLAGPIWTNIEALLRQSAAKEEDRDSIQAKSVTSLAGSFDAGDEVESRLSQSKGGGSPLPDPVRTYMEPRFGVDFRHVRVYTDSAAIQMNRDIAAQAFTHGADIYYGAGSSPTNLELTAHELTHVIQQTGGAPLQTEPPATASPAEPHPPMQHRIGEPDSIQRNERLSVSQQSPTHIQRFGIPNPLSFLADKASLIPGFRMLNIILGVNPINMSRVDRSAANILRALIEFMPGGALITQALDNYGIVDKVGAWVEKQTQSLGMTGSAIKLAITQFIGSFDLTEIFTNPGGLWERAKRIFTDPIDRLINFAKGLVTGIITFIKDAILMPLAKLAERTRGYDLLKAVLGKDPITGEAVPRTAETLIGGFMKLIKQDDVWENMKKANAVGRAWAWFQKAISTLTGFVVQIPTLAKNAFKSLEVADIVMIPRAFAKVAAVFGNFIGSFFSWAGNAAWNLLEIIFDVVSPGALSYIKRTGAAFKNILKNPIPFVDNLVKAAKLGFQNFAANFAGHLKAGLLDWLTGSLPGVYIPKSFSLGEIVKFVFSVLGISWQNIRIKLVKVVGENTVKAMETGFDIVVTLVKDGPAAAWDKIKDQLANLKDMVIGGITDFVVDMVVKKAVPKIVSMFVPGAGFISAILSIYDTIMVFVHKLSKIAQVVTAFIESITAIAKGAIGAAASRMESTLAGLLSLAINFLAGFAGLGNVAEKIMGVTHKVRGLIDKALDALINWIVKMAKKLFAKVFGKKDKPDERTDEQKQADVGKAVAEGTTLLKDKELSSEQVKNKLLAIKDRYNMTVLELVTDAESESKETDYIRGAINPAKDGEKVEKERDHTGTKHDPVPMKWFKGFAWYAKSFDRDDPFRSGRQRISLFPHKEYPPDGFEAGVDGEYFPFEGKLIQKTDQEERAGGVEKFRAELEEHNVDLEGVDIDHVQDIMFGGPDIRENMWPLERHKNRKAGSDQNLNQIVKLHRPVKGTWKIKDVPVGIWFVIRQIAK